MAKYPNLYSEIKVGGVTLKNRIVMPPMGTNYANVDGTITPRMIEYNTERARGGVGLIIVEASTVDYPRGRSTLGQPTINNEKDIPRWLELTDKVHAYGTKIICQIIHAGFTTTPEMSGGFENVTATDTDEFELVGFTCNKSRALTTEEVDEMVGKFVKAAVIAKRGGLDGVEVHAAHGYLLNQFLSPLTNKRTDKFGGSIENRALIVTSIIKGIREACGENFLISVRIPGKDYIPGGITLEDSAVIAKLLEDAGADLISISVGYYYTIADPCETQERCEGYRLYLAEAIKPKIKKARLLTAGKILRPEMAESVIAKGTADLVAMGRQIICDPFWPAKVEEGREEEIRRCLSCNQGCLGNMFGTQSGVRCVINPYVGFEERYRESFTPRASSPKKVVVAGGGIA
ncbi:MAG TPA: NADH:flavin oxidoreductase, partial [Anaerovoracaceae bacterium]|nr:NADH:flavin oxidoreductase [Anaerovoracaceae bacterium]